MLGRGAMKGFCSSKTGGRGQQLSRKMLGKGGPQSTRKGSVSPEPRTVKGCFVGGRRGHSLRDAHGTCSAASSGHSGHRARDCVVCRVPRRPAGNRLSPLRCRLASSPQVGPRYECAGGEDGLGDGPRVIAQTGRCPVAGAPVSEPALPAWETRHGGSRRDQEPG